MVDFVNTVRSFVNYAIFCELCDQMRSEVDCFFCFFCILLIFVDLSFLQEYRCI